MFVLRPAPGHLPGDQPFRTPDPQELVSSQDRCEPREPCPAEKNTRVQNYSAQRARQTHCCTARGEGQVQREGHVGRRGGERTSASHGAKSACEREGGSPGILLPHSFWKHGLCLPEESFQPPGEGADGPSRLCAGRGGARELSVPAECRVPRAGGDNSRTPASLSRRHFNASLPPRTPGLWCPRGPGDGSELNSGFLGGRGRLPGSATPPLPHSPSLSCLESEGLSSKVWDG